MQAYFLRNLAELAEKRAIIMRQEAQLWDIFSRDLKREAGREKETPVRRLVRDPMAQTSQTPQDTTKLVVRIPEAARMMGMSRGTLYKEINEGRINVRKAGRNTFIAVADIQAWFERLPVGLS